MQRAAQTQTLDFVFLSRVSCRSQCARSYRSEDLQSRSIRTREKKKKKKKKKQDYLYLYTASCDHFNDSVKV